MAFTTTSNFSGKAAGFYISAALKEAKSLDFLNVIENIKFKSNIQRMAGSGVVADATCDFTDTAAVTLTERIIQPEEFQVNLQLCKSDFINTWIKRINPINK